MVTTSSSADLVFAALADPVRRSILERLARGEATVGELAAPYPISRPAVSKHLRILESAGLVHRVRDGRVNRCRLDPRPLRDVTDWVARNQAFWEQQLASLAGYLEQAARRPGTRHT